MERPEHWDTLLIEALLAALQGYSQNTESHIRRWQRATRNDVAESTNTRHFSCHILGMANATSAAVACIRESLSEPSFVMPFIEPFLPFYDGIRHEPAVCGSSTPDWAGDPPAYIFRRYSPRRWGSSTRRVSLIQFESRCEGTAYVPDADGYRVTDGRFSRPETVRLPAHL